MPAMSFARLRYLDRNCQESCESAAVAFARAGRRDEAAWAQRMAAYYRWRQVRWTAIEDGADLPPPTLEEFRRLTRAGDQSRLIV